MTPDARDRAVAEKLVVTAWKAHNVTVPLPLHGADVVMAAYITAALTAERERAERAERERKEMEMRVIACGVAATHPDAELTARAPYADRWGSQQLLYVRALRAERDTLRQHNAVLRAECQAGRVARDGNTPPNVPPNTTIDEYKRLAEKWARDGVRLLNLYDAARAATDAAGAMGDTEVRRE